MKQYRINYQYRGRYFDFILCAKSYKEAAKRIGISEYHFKTYGFSSKIENPYTEILLKPYSHNTRHLFDYSKEYEFEYVKRIVDSECDKEMNILKSI
mgnify:CR=1 FL=1|tara:strand:+ start:415 stop:705 length:291 start_codon:yes stop_codon:yes gene_type:complete